MSSSKRKVTFNSHRRMLMEEILNQEGISSDPTKKIRPQDHSGPTVVSFAQQRMWFLEQLVAGSPLFNIPFALRMKGQLDVPILQQSFDEIIRRHEILRTTFTTVEKQPRQIVNESFSLKISEIDLSAFPKDKRDQEAQHQASIEVKKLFDLTRLPLMRVTLLKLHDTDHLLVISMHHIISDGWSVQIFFRELTALYTQFKHGQPSPLKALPIQYADFSIWQREWLQGDVEAEQLTYWKEQLAGDLPILELPSFSTRPPIQTFPGGVQSIFLSAELTEKLTAFSQQEDFTLFMTFLAAWKALIFRYTGQTDVLIGTPIANRTRTEVQQLIGFFVNTLVLRTDLSGNPTFRELVKRVRHVALEAYMHPELPFERLVEVLQPERDLSHTTLFQIGFAFQGSATQTFVMPDLDVRLQPISTDTAKFDMSIFVTPVGQKLRIGVEYSADIFDAETIIRLLDHFKTMLESIATNPDQRIGDLPILTPAEQHQLLEQWNDTTTPYSSHLCIHELFEAQAAQTPDAVAVIFEDEELTYHQLNLRSNQLAHYLQSLGVGPDQLVGICIERSIELVIALLGVLKAGGAYVPLDPNYPHERLQFMIENSQAQVLLTQSGLMPQLAPSTAHCICLDNAWETIADYSTTPPPPSAHPDNLAYIIYTSGSTGQPKGVMVSHRSLSNHMLWRQTTYPLGVADRVLQRSPFSFDVSIWEFFWPLIAGARIVMADPNNEKDSRYITQLIADQQITVARFMPASLSIFLNEPDIKRCTSLRIVRCGGETLSVEIQERFFKALDAGLFVGYGPTEACISVTEWECHPQTKRRIVPIGRPIANTRLYVLDPALRPVPAGVIGELYIGGVSLARGYLNRPDLTAERFIPDPFSQRPGARLYKTGDLVRYWHDGVLEFHGRTDHQVKVRGFRIELGEIEAVLDQHPSVSSSIVVALDDNAGTKRLVAYSVTRPGAVVATDSLREFLQTKLPEHMIPSAFVVLDAFPLTSNGKIDRGALPKPEVTGTQAHATFIAPRTAVEQVLAGIWSDILGIEEIGTHDNFFMLGGHSLLGMQVVADVRDIFQVDIHVRVLFEAPTVAKLAEVLLASENDRARIERIATVLMEITDMSDDEVEMSLMQEPKPAPTQ